jgi:hypothetical protein
MEEHMRTTTLLLGIALAIAMAAGPRVSVAAQLKDPTGEIGRPGVKDVAKPLTLSECSALKGQLMDIDLKVCSTGKKCSVYVHGELVDLCITQQ